MAHQDVQQEVQGQREGRGISGDVAEKVEQGENLAGPVEPVEGTLFIKRVAIKDFLTY